MLKAILFGVLLALASAIVVGAQSQQPSSQPDQKRSAQEIRGSENIPFIVKVIPTEKSDDEQNSEIAKREADRKLVELTGDLARYTKFLFFATGGLVVITAGLVIVGYRQVRDARQSIAAAVKSAAAAEKAANAAENEIAIIGSQTDTLIKQHKVARLQFFATHRPKLIVRKIRLEAWRDTDGMSVSYIVANVGRSDAFITEHRTIIGIEEERTDGRVARIEPQAAVKNTLTSKEKITITPGEHHEVTAGPTHWKYKEEYAIETGPKRPIFMGHLLYEDAVGNKRRTEFWRSYRRSIGDFTPSPYPDEEYIDE
jgi:hypothetical protein